MWRCLVLAFAVVVPSTAAADPVTVSSGFVIFTDEPGEFHLAGPRTSVSGSWFPQLASGTFWHDRCSPCQPGAPVDFGVTTYTFSADRSAISGGTINGTAYSELFYDAQWTFRGPTLLAPLNLGGPMTSTGLFSFSGRLAAFANEARTGTPLLSAEFEGGGTARAFFGGLFDHEGSPVTLTDLEYRFDDPAPVPEPSTIVLVATGLAAAGFRRRKR